MPKTDHDRTLALAALFQATVLVRSIAHSGHADPDDFAACIDSVFKVDAADTEDVYGGVRRLRTGLRRLVEQLRSPQDLETTRYVIALLVLERKLAKRPALLGRLREGIDTALARLQYFPATHDNTIAGLADLYAATISTIPPRILVHGEHSHLTQPENANRIRALLLAGIRAAVLWRQSGGGRLTLLLRRKRLLREAQQMLNTLEV